MNPNDYLVLSAILFAIGIVGFLTSVMPWWLLCRWS